ncbi:MAG: Hsp20/alpha crystallin family protein [Bacteroidetes bacterium]|nr:Hsp20/alpha crystallin family protein [Bacteroidota bacterium]
MATLVRTMLPTLWSDPFAPDWTRSIARDIDRMVREIDALWEQTFGWARLGRVPNVEVFDTDSEFIIRAELPGLRKEDIKITLVGDQLTLEGERKPDPKFEKARVHRAERWYGTFRRTFVLPFTPDGKPVEARFRNGVLVITIPKPEAQQPRQIVIK